MKRFISLILAAMLAVIPVMPALAAAPYALERGAALVHQNDEIAAPAAEAPKPTVRGELAKLADTNWLGLTREQYVEDADYLVNVLLENYPYLGTLKRMTGQDLKTAYAEFRPQLEECKGDMDFYLKLTGFIDSMEGVGHLGVLMPPVYEFFAESYGKLSSDDSYDMERMTKLAKAYTNPLSKKSYEGLGETFNSVWDRVMAYYQNEDEAAGKNVANVTTKIIEDGKIAYIKINSFDMLQFEADKKILFDFYAKVKDFENVIFDISENGGGGMSYFDELIASPNISETLYTDVYMFMRDSEYNRKFINIDAGAIPISKLPPLPRMNADDLKLMDVFTTQRYEVRPLSDEKMLNGRLWLLVSGMVYSSSEYAAIFSKATGFATLVGTNTGGDGIGVDPLPIVLPNSGLIVRYSAIYGTGPDGAGSQEFGTAPDIQSEEGETPLETCLRAISEGK